MIIRERGVLGESSAYFHTPSMTAQQLFFTLSCVGRYICDGEYAVDRISYDSFLILYVVRGRGYCEIGGQRVTLGMGELAIIDCYRPHRYGTQDGWEILWMHIGGGQARAYFDAIVQGRRQIIRPRDAYHASRGLERTHRMFHEGRRISEARISKNIVDVLTAFLTFDTPEEDVPGSGARIEEALAYISSHIGEEITLELLARRVSLSPFYFSRVFRRETGRTLREYLVHARVNAARFYLRTTELTLSEIRSRCGYGSDSTFCTAFRRVTGLTPMQYRSLSGEENVP